MMHESRAASTQPECQQIASLVNEARRCNIIDIVGESELKELVNEFFTGGSSNANANLMKEMMQRASRSVFNQRHLNLDQGLDLLDEDRANKSSDVQPVEGPCESRLSHETSLVSNLSKSQVGDGYRSSSFQGQTCENSATSETTSTSLPKTSPRCEGSKLDEMGQLWETDTDYRICSEHNRTKGTKVNSQHPPSPSSSGEVGTQERSEVELELHDIDYRVKPFDSVPALTVSHLVVEDSHLMPGQRCRSEERSRSAVYPLCDENSLSQRTNDYIRAKSVDSFSGGSDSHTFTDKALVSEPTGKSDQDLNSCTVKEPTYKASLSKTYISDQGSKHFAPASSHREEDSDIATDAVSYKLSADNSGVVNSQLPIQRYLSSESNVVGPNDNYQSTGTTLNSNVEDIYMSSDPDSSSVSTFMSCQSNQASNHTHMSKVMASYESTTVSGQDNVSSSARCIKNVADESKYPTREELSKNNLPCERSSKVEEYKSTNLDDEYQQPVEDNVCKHVPPESIESCYQQSKSENSCQLPYKNLDSAKHVSSYKQHTGDDVEDMDAETEEEDSAHISVSPSIYQSYEEDIMAAHYHTAALASMVGNTAMMEQYNSADQSEGWSRRSSGDEEVLPVSSVQLSCTGSYSSSPTYTSTQNTLTIAATSLAKDQGNTSTTATSLSPPSSTQAHGSTAEVDEDHEGALCTGDQTFRSAAARQSALVPFMKPAQSRTFVSTINPTLYAGQSVVQGVRGPSVMTSSSVHIAQHPGGATIMRQQSMSTGLNGGVAQATVMQQQAMHNGVQATAVVQQRTLTNGGQTMLVQQRTMTTGLGAMSQQTVVQQRVAAPASMAQAAALHASAMRQRAMASQTGVMPHRAVRMLQTRVVGNPVVRAQALRGPTLIQHMGNGSSTTLLGPSLVRGASQGSVMQQLVRQRYLGGPVMPGRGIQMMAGRPIRVKMTYPRETLPMESNT